MDHFTEEEFRCKCGNCDKGFDDMNPGTLQKLFRARRDPAVLAANVKFKITSAIRCEAHNAAVGGVDSSAHVSGHAIDIQAADSRRRFIIVAALLDAGFPRVGVSDTFIHADDSPEHPQPRLWTY